LNAKLNTPRVLAITLITAALLGLAGVPMAIADVGFRDFAYRDTNRVEIPTADKPQSKLWFQDDSWWGVLYSPLTGSTRGCASGCANDHLNVKQLTSDGTGRVFAAVKTANRNTGQPFVLLIVRDAQGTWSSHVFGAVEDLHTRPMIMIDEEHRQLFMFAVAPEVGGGIYYKQTSLDAISFPPGVGTPFIQGSLDGDISNPTTTKQNVNGTTGLVVLASANRNAYYWHNFLNLADLPQVPPVAPTNVSVSLPASKPESRLKVSWSDNSVNESGFTVERKTGAGTFRKIASPGAGSSSYTDSGLVQDTTYTYRVQALNAAGRSSYSTEASATTAMVLIFTPFADAYVDAAVSGSNFGPSPSLRLDASPVQQSYLLFQLTGVTGSSVRSAQLRLYVSDDGSAKGGTVARTSDVGWQEASVSYDTRPAIDGPALSSLGAVSVGQWYQLNVTSAVTGDGTLGLGLRTNSGDGVGYASREDSDPPQLVVTLTH
jgi:hypothetical protein